MKDSGSIHEATIAIDGHADYAIAATALPHCQKAMDRRRT
jgi:hypothetical protein